MILKNVVGTLAEFWQVSFLYAKIYKRTGRNKFHVSVYKKSRMKNGENRERIFIK